MMSLQQLSCDLHSKCIIEENTHDLNSTEMLKMPKNEHLSIINNCSTATALKGSKFDNDCSFYINDKICDDNLIFGFIDENDENLLISSFRNPTERI